MRGNLDVLFMDAGWLLLLLLPYALRRVNHKILNASFVVCFAFNRAAAVFVNGLDWLSSF